MGCDIHAFIEKQAEDGSWQVMDSVFNFRNYGVFGFLADVRNYSEAEPLQKMRGLPSDVSAELKDRWQEDDDSLGIHSTGFLRLNELLNFDYSKMFYDMRVLRGGNGAARARSLEEATHTSYRDFLGRSFFDDLERMKRLSDDPSKIRVVFWFDN